MRQTSTVRTSQSIDHDEDGVLLYRMIMDLSPRPSAYLDQQCVSAPGWYCSFLSKRQKKRANHFDCAQRKVTHSTELT